MKNLVLLPVSTIHVEKSKRLLAFSLSLFWVLLCNLIMPVAGKSQITNFALGSGSIVNITGLPAPLCGGTTGAYACYAYDAEPNCGGPTLKDQVASVLQNTPPSNFLVAQADVPYYMHLVNASAFLYPFMGGLDSYVTIYSTSDAGTTFGPGHEYMSNTSNDGTNHHFDAIIRFPKGTLQGALVIPIYEGDWLQSGQYVRTNIIIPFYIGGVLPIAGGEVPILGTTVDPQIPYMILHDPQGDGSSSSFQENTTTCRSKETTYAKDEANEIHGTVKLGVKGSIGLIATVDYEIYVEFSGSANIGDLNIKNSTDEVCVSVGEGFSTADLPGADGAGDVFIGFGRDLYYGIYDVVDFRECTAFIESRLVYAPVPGTDRKFVYSEEDILADIANQQAIVDDTLRTSKDRSTAQSQKSVWEQVLALNEENINNPDNDTLQLLTYSAGNTQTYTNSIEITETKSITTEHYIDGTFGVDGVLNIAGSGFSLGYKYATSERFGSTQGQSSGTSQVVEYTLTDDDPGDLFNVNIVRDPMFGTPVFRLNQGSKTSCPYEGGYRRDQPVLQIANTTETEYYTDGNPDGSVATFKVDLCNESNEERQYFLKLNAQSNLNGAEVKAAGVALNGNDLGQEFNIAAHDCVEDLIINVTQQQGSPELSYPNLEIFLYSECDPDVSSSIFADVYFGDATAIKDVRGDATMMNVFPNPTSGTLNIQMADANLMDAYTLRDMTGKVVEQESYSSPIEQSTLNVSIMPSGIYLLQVRSGHQLVSKKVMVQ